MVSKKKLIEIATNDEIIDYLREINNINANMCYKTKYEQKTAKREMDKYAQYIVDILNGFEE